MEGENLYFGHSSEVNISKRKISDLCFFIYGKQFQTIAIEKNLATYF